MIPGALLKPSALAARDAVSIDPSLISFFIQDNFVQNYIAFAMLTLVIYNALITFDKQVHFFWKKPVTVVGCIFFLNQINGTLGAVSEVIGGWRQMSAETCQFSQWTTVLSNLLTILLIDYILLLRVLALYSENKNLAVVLRLTFALETLAFLVLTIYTEVSADILLGELAPGLFLCGGDNVPSQILESILWVIPSAYGTLLMTIALYKAAQLWKENQGFRGAELAKVLIQDQIFYFFLVIFCTVANLLGFVTNFNTILAYVFSGAGSPALLCVLGSHLLIHLREAGEAGRNLGTSYNPRSISAMDFGQAAEQSASDVIEGGGGTAPCSSA